MSSVKDRCNGQIRQVSERVLFVDDKEINRITAKALLGSFCADVQIASSGRDALQLVESEQPEIVLLDLLMPEMGGIETARRIRKLEVSQPVIIAVTGQLADQVRHEVEAAGIDAILEKPYAVETLRNEVYAALELLRTQ